MLDSTELASRASGGDDAALDELLVRHLPRLRTFVRFKAGPLVRAREAESDIVQSTCREVLERAPEVLHGGEAGFRHWLFTTALRKILDKRRHHTAGKRDMRREVAVGAESDADGSGGIVDEAHGGDARFASPSGEAIGREELERIAAAMADLSDDHREVVLLSRVVGLSRAEVASEMGRTEGSVRNLLHRALAELARRLDGPGASGG